MKVVRLVSAMYMVISRRGGDDQEGDDECQVESEGVVKKEKYAMTVHAAVTAKIWSGLFGMKAELVLYDYGKKAKTITERILGHNMNSLMTKLLVRDEFPVHKEICSWFDDVDAIRKIAKARRSGNEYVIVRGYDMEE